MKKIAAVITDTHLSDKNIDLVKDVFKQFFEYCKNNGIDKIFHAGDWFTSRTGQSIDCLMATREILEMMHRDYQLEMWAIAGNHDKANQNSSESFLSLFEGIPGFRLVTLMGGVPLLKGKLNVSLIPFFTKEIYEEKLAEINTYLFEDLEGFNPDQKHILITHSAINGVKNNDGSEVQSGTAKSTFKNFHSVLVGHYHNRSKIGTNIHYIGSAYQANYGEDPNKGWVTISEDGSLEYHTSKFPEYITYNVPVHIAGSSLTIKKIEEDSKENFVRVILTGTEDEVRSFDKTKLEKIGATVTIRPDEEEMQEEEQIEHVSFNEGKILEAWIEFCEKKEIKNKELGISLINETLNV
jgi:DNA repair protein SbcD/Mre11